MSSPILPPGVQVFQRGWLSSNNVLLLDPLRPTLIDSGYATHSEQTLSLVASALGHRPLTHLYNTHLHSDHCGGNAALQARYPDLHTAIPPGLADAVRDWDERRLTYEPTGQQCPRFGFQSLLKPGDSFTVGALRWDIHAAPGHDTHSVILFEPSHRLLISADALWQNGFGVVFPELEGSDAFDEVGDTLDLIERLDPRLVIPGHGEVFEDVSPALERARRRLDGFQADPQRHGVHAAKVLLKFKLLEWQSVSTDDMLDWAGRSQYIRLLHERFGSEQPFEDWIDQLVNDLVRAGAVQRDHQQLKDA